MTQLIKPNDLVYIPSRTKNVCTVKLNKDGFIVEDGEIINHINAQGYLYDFSLTKWIEQPFAFLATPENKKKLEQVYGELEDIPSDEELENFCKEIDLLLSAQDALSIISVPFNHTESDSNQTKRTRLTNQVKEHRENLIQMFKERGAK